MPKVKKNIDTDLIPATAFDAMKDKLLNKPAPIDNTDLVKEFRELGGQLLHFRPRRNWLKATWSRGMTLAFVTKGSRVTVATSLTHGADHFCKKNGTKVAIEHFKEGKTVTLPIPRGKTPVAELKRAFRELCW